MFFIKKGGYGGTEERYFSTIFKLELEKRIAWENVKYKGFFPKRSGMYCIGISNSKILIFGGGDDNQELNDEIFEFSKIKENEYAMEQLKCKMPEKTTAWTESPRILIKQKIYIFDHNEDLLIYDINTSKFSKIAYENWNI